MAYTLHNGEIEWNGKKKYCPFIPPIPTQGRFEKLERIFQACCISCVHFEMTQVKIKVKEKVEEKEIETEQIVDVAQITCGSGKVIPVTILNDAEPKPGPKLVKAN